jgi:hypothetical protein
MLGENSLSHIGPYRFDGIRGAASRWIGLIEAAF